MNFDVDKLLAALQDGASAEELGASFAEALNRAVDLQEERDKEAEEKERKQEAKREYAQDVVRALADYIANFHPEEKEIVEELRQQASDTQALDKLVQDMDYLVVMIKGLERLKTKGHDNWDAMAEMWDKLLKW